MILKCQYSDINLDKIKLLLWFVVFDGDVGSNGRRLEDTGRQIAS